MSPKKIVPPLLLLVVGGAAFWFYRSQRIEPDEDTLAASGTVEATDAQLGFAGAGRIESIDVREGDAVAAGQELARLDRAELEARRAQAVAQVAAARAALADLERGSRREEIAQARAALTAAEERRRDAQRDLERTRRLYEGGAVSREALDKAETALDVFTAQRDQVAEQLRLVREGPSREKIDAARAQVAQAEAALQGAEAALGNTVMSAPFAGRVTVRNRQAGETVSPGAPVLTLMDPRDRWVRIYVKEDRLGAVKLGTRAAITSDTYPGKTYPGEVSYISSEAEFTPKSVQTAEERVRLVYAVKVRITGDPGHELKPGLPADVRLEVAP